MRAADRISIALPKGRLLSESIALFSEIGISCVETLLHSRRLIAEDQERSLRFVTLRATDIPTYVEHGAVDMGIVGKDQLLEQERDVYEPLDLGFGLCRIVVAAAQDLASKDDPRAWNALRIATKYPRLAERHFSAKGIPVEIVKLYGSIEIAPLVGLAERIVDLVSTGRTLRENGLAEVEEISRSTARLIVNRASLKTKYRQVQEIIEALRKQVEVRSRRPTGSIPGGRGENDADPESE